MTWYLICIPFYMKWLNGIYFMTLLYKTLYINELTSHLHPVFHEMVKWDPLYDFAVQNVIQ